MKTTYKNYQEEIDYKERDAKGLRQDLKKSSPLLTFDFQEQGPGEHWIGISTPELTSICPFSNYPDFGSGTWWEVGCYKCGHSRGFCFDYYRKGAYGDIG